MRGCITHVSIDGLSTTLGQSQVLAVSERLQSMGWNCTILSLEPESAPHEELGWLYRRVKSSGIRWRHQPYRPGRLGAPRNVATMSAMVRESWSDTELFHCRSYFAAFFGAASDFFRGVPYVFDTRGYWVDEKIDSGRWFQDPVSAALGRQVERQLYERADAVVSLTEIAARDVRSGRFGRRHAAERSICIPTCVDYDRFTMKRADAPHDFLREGPIVAHVGALNPSYALRESLDVARRILAQVPSAKFLALTSQVTEMASLMGEHAIPKRRSLVTRVPHYEIHRWLPWIDFGLLLLVRPNQAKRASMPTKLGEFFATGIAPICHGANHEVEGWVERTGAGIVLPDLSSSSLDRAVELVARGRPTTDVLERARDLAAPHFSLASGVRRYDDLFQGVLASAKRREV